MESLIEREDVDAILSGIFDLNTKLARIAESLEEIARLLENGDDDEEEEGPSGPAT